MKDENGGAGEASRAMIEAADGAAMLERAFARSFDNIESGVLRAARTGSLSVRGMVDAIVSDLGRLAMRSFVTQPLEGFLNGLFQFGGKRAAGGPVAPGRSYLVGENGQELFTPSGHGAIAPNGAPGRAGASVVVNVTTRDAPSFLRSEAQLSAMLSRVAARGARRA